jgi:acylphosphatase
MHRDVEALGSRRGGEERVVRVVARGRVQGVGFRWHVREAARLAGIRGWVRNCADGSVELLAAGSHSGVDRVVEAVRHGPPAARVYRVDVHPSGDEPVPDTFTVR